ncbi:MAG: BamA/TamA family outer membrane protein [Roseobacter sp.]
MAQSSLSNVLSGGATIACAACFAVTCAAPADAQNKPFQAPTELAEKTAPKGYGFRTGSFIAAPIPFESPSLGTGLALGGAYLFQNDRLSDASSLGFGAFRSSNDSYGFGLGLNLSWDEDRWTMQFLAAEADLNYDLFVAGAPIPISQELSGARFQLAYSPVKNYSFGGSLDYGEYTLTPRFVSALPTEFQPDARLKIARLSAFAEYDTRDDTIYPTRGTFLKGTISGGTFVDLNRSNYSKGVLSATFYQPLFESGVLVAHAVGCSSSNAAPFFDSCSIGTTDSFRGYISTEFIGNGLTSVQAEYRGKIIGRFGYTIFAGAASIGSSFTRAATGTYQTAAGVGVRIRLSKDFPLDYAIDMARNERGEDNLYISVGQRF